MTRVVLYVDPPAFCVAVERVVTPSLRARPVAVAPLDVDRATLLALSREAGTAGLVRGMAVREARRRCPDLILLPPNPALYARASRALHAVLAHYTPVIEPRGWGHAYLDLSGTERLLGPPAEVASRLQHQVQNQLRLPVVVGVAMNKLVSTMASTIVKHDTLARGCVGQIVAVPAGTEAAYLAPHSVALLPDLPVLIRTRLEDYQLARIGEVAAIPAATLATVFGRAAWPLHAAAQGHDARPVLSPMRRAELHLAHTLASDTNDLGILLPLLRQLCAHIGQRLRARGLAAARLVVTVTYSDHTTAHRRVSLPVAPLDAELYAAAHRAFTATAMKRLAVRDLAVTATDLVAADGHPSAQLDLWTAAPSASATLSPAMVRAARLQPMLDRVAARFGSRALTVGRVTAPASR
ncbi:MAG TPA: hypothetical protein VFN83_09255 [Gemmatimonadales bacterium]|nr:hypothetical protein [Gemmatimonadales bacterium]